MKVEPQVEPPKGLNRASWTLSYPENAVVWVAGSGGLKAIFFAGRDLVAYRDLMPRHHHRDSDLLCMSGSQRRWGCSSEVHLFRIASLVNPATCENPTSHVELDRQQQV